jgi:serine/threonine protein phosphatase PrpC
MEKLQVRVVSAAVSDKGLSDKRPVNEDSYLEMPEQGLFAVADGVGGAQAGDFASQTAMEVLQQAFSHKQSNLTTHELLEMAIQRANESIFQMSHELPQLEMMATTIVALHLENNVASVGHVGDSRLYRLDENGKLSRETRDHSMVEEEVKAGRMTSVQAANHPSRNVISRALGAESAVEVEMQTINFEAGTTFLLCSDGVTRHLEDHEIRQVLERFASPSDICNEIKSICYSRGAEDNLTAVVVKVEDSAISVLEDDTTITDVRPVFAPDPLPVLSNNSLQGGGTNSTAIRTDEFTAANAVYPDASAAPLAALPADVAEGGMQNKLEPASRTFGVTDEPIDPAAYQPTLEPKIENERLRSKIDAAQSSDNNEVSQESSGLENLFRSLFLLAVGVLIGAGGYYAWMLMSPPQTAAPTKQPANTIAPLNSNNDLSPQEINEFRMFERVRRTVDTSPSAAQNRFQNLSNGTAADYYLRGRAFLLLGETPNARKDFLAAADELAKGNDGGVNPDTLKFDIAIAGAAVGAVSLTREDRKMLEDLIKTQQDRPANASPAQPTR